MMGVWHTPLHRYGDDQQGDGVGCDAVVHFLQLAL